MAISCYSTNIVTIKNTQEVNWWCSNPMLLLIPKVKTYYFKSDDRYRTAFDLERFQSICTGNMCYMKTIIKIDVIIVLNNISKMINQVLTFCKCYIHIHSSRAMGLSAVCDCGIS